MKQHKLVLALGAVLSVTFATALSAANPDPNRVMIQFTPGSKGAVMSTLRGLGAQVHHELDIANAVAATVPPQALEGLRHNPHIALIEVDAPRYALGETIPYGIVNTQADLAVAAGADGDYVDGSQTVGVKVCIIDSGIKANHEDFVGVTMTGQSGNNWSTDSCGHGTHVAGTIAAVGGNSKGVVGVSPGKVDLHIVKVFDGASCAWSYASTLVAAAQECQSANAKIISMSLGGSVASTTERNAFAAIDSAGILSIAAAGNDGNNRHSYPASYAGVMSVAAVDSANVVASFSQYTNEVEIAAPGVGVLSTYPISSGSVTVAGTGYMASAMEGSPALAASGNLVNGGRCAATGAYAGKVVLCERGDIDFATKVLNVQNSGGIAAIIYNNVSGGFGGTLGTVSTSIPSVSVSREDGLLMLAASPTAIAVVDAATQTDVNGYAYLDGTSMATPHVSGVAALLWSAKPTATHTEIRNAMTSTALDRGAAGRDNYYGHGVVQANAARLALLAGGGGGGGTVAVAAPTLAFAKSGRSYIARGTTTVTQGGSALSGASVSGCFTGAVTGCTTGTTASNGSVTLSSAKFSTRTAVTFCVTSVNGTSYNLCTTGTPN